jgi:hypothetical protein
MELYIHIHSTHDCYYHSNILTIRTTATVTIRPISFRFVTNLWLIDDWSVTNPKLADAEDTYKLKVMQNNNQSSNKLINDVHWYMSLFTNTM